MPRRRKAALCMAGESECSTGSPNTPATLVFPVISTAFIRSPSALPVKAPSAGSSSCVAGFDHLDREDGFHLRVDPHRHPVGAQRLDGLVQLDLALVQL